MNRSQARTEARGRVRIRVRQRVRGAAERPRLAVFKSGRHIYAQVIDDGKGATLAHASSLDAGPEERSAQGRFARRRRQGRRARRRAGEEGGRTKVVFDRGGYRYHGRVKALAEGARTGGLEF